MIIKSKKVSDVEVTSLEDLKKLKPLMDNDMANVNFTQLGEELKKDPRTIKNTLMVLKNLKQEINLVN